VSELHRFRSSRDREGSRAARPASVERERRVVEGLKGGLSMAEIAGREGITERGVRKYVRNLIARRAPEVTGEFIAVQMSRLNEALLVSFGAMSGENLASVDRVVKIVRELDRYHGLGGGARGTETRRKLLESLVSAAEMTAPPHADRVRGEELAAGTEADPTPDRAEPLADRLPQEAGPEQRGTESLRNPLESLNPGAAMAPAPPPLNYARPDFAPEAQPCRPATPPIRPAPPSRPEIQSETPHDPRESRSGRAGALQPIRVHEFVAIRKSSENERSAL